MDVNSFFIPPTSLYVTKTFNTVYAVTCCLSLEENLYDVFSAIFIFIHHTISSCRYMRGEKPVQIVRPNSYPVSCKGLEMMQVSLIFTTMIFVCLTLWQQIYGSTFRGLKHYFKTFLICFILLCC